MTRPPSSEDPAAAPSIARIYDYFLGGHHNFQVDRDAAAQMAAIYPDLPLVLRANRAFLRRVVRFLTEQGIRQFVDLGSGIPTAGNVHEIAQRLSPNARVAYVDIDPVAVVHSAAILKGNPLATVIGGDARYPAEILNHPNVRALINRDEPVGVLMAAFLHFVPDDAHAEQIVREIVAAIPSGSYVAVSHMVPSDESMAGRQGEAAEIYRRTTAPLTARSPETVARLFAGLELVEPGLVPVPLWRPESPDDLFLETPRRSASVGGVGRKP